MLASSRVAIIDLVLSIRERFLAAKAARNTDDLIALSQCLDIIRDVAWAKGDEPLATLSQDLLDAVQDTLTGVEWKSSALPTEEAIFSQLA